MTPLNPSMPDHVRPIASHETSPVMPMAPSGPGAIAGYRSQCSCGAEITSSLFTLCSSEAAAHRRYFDAQSVCDAHVRAQLSKSDRTRGWVVAL